MLYSAIRPLLFSLNAEKAHDLSLASLDKLAYFLPTPKLDTNPTKIMGLTFPNKIGLAAGLDKNGNYITALGKFGFGFIEVGTVTPKPQAGNPKPRLFRLPEHQAIINRMGFNNKGIQQLIRNVKKSRYNGILGINIGKNKDTPNSEASKDYIYCLELAYPCADYISINISSPNTKGLRELQDSDNIKYLINSIKEKQQQLTGKYGYKPIVIKISPDLNNASIIRLAEIFKSYDVDGIIATNTTVDKSAIASSILASEEGGLSGKPLLAKSSNIIRVFADELNNKVPIIGVGGVSSLDSAQEKLDAGASLVQVYSGFIYQGPELIRKLKNKLH